VQWQFTHRDKTRWRAVGSLPVFEVLWFPFVSFWKQLTLSQPSYRPIETARPSALFDKIARIARGLKVKAVAE
jgi:hypothetical protein